MDGRFLTNIGKRAGIEVPFTPWAAALFKERQDTEGRDRPAERCENEKDVVHIFGKP